MLALEKVIEVLLQNGADVNATDHSGRTPLHTAATSGYEKIVEMLIENGTCVDTKDQNGWTPLFYAAAHREF